MNKKISCTCDVCGVEYEKPAIYKKWNDLHPNVFFKWSLMYCDKHRRAKQMERKQIEEAYNAGFEDNTGIHTHDLKW